MNNPAFLLRNKLQDLVSVLKPVSRPSRNALLDAAQTVLDWKTGNSADSLWPSPPTLVTATIDDAWGHGLEIIHLYARTAGVKLVPLGILQTPETIITACRNYQADMLGMTVLQFDSDDALKCIRKQIPQKTVIIAGGPLFQADPDFAEQAGVDVVARNAVVFLEYLLSFQKGQEKNLS